MVFDPRSFLEVSRGFCVHGRTEAEYRTAISRALYAVFLWARAELEARGEGVTGKSDEERVYEHSRVRSRFKQGRFRHDGVYQRLGALYKLRYRSDYDLEATLGQADLAQALEYAKYIQGVFTLALFSKPGS